MLKISAGDDDDDDDRTEQKKTTDSFMLSQSGSFKTEDFKLNRQGLSNSVSAPQRFSSMSSISSRDAIGNGMVPVLEIASMDELEMGEVTAHPPALSSC